VFLLPALAFFLVFVAYPIVFVVYSSFFRWSTTANMVFAGLSNFQALVHDADFWLAMRNTMYWGLLTIPIQMLLGGLIAYLIEEKVQRLRGFFRTAYFLPVVTPVVVIAIVWENMYAPYYGVIGHWLQMVGIKAQINWLGSDSTAIFAVIIVNIWEWTGFSMLMYVAGLHNISQELKEAARIDGAVGFRILRDIYIPLLAPVHKALLLLGIIGTLQTFALVYSMTGGGPDHASEMPGTYIFREGFTNQQMGYAASIAVAVLVLTLILTATQLRLFGTGTLFGQKEDA
jgi:multiple sugar transport system permease protein/raffinose/stachyose/melibiose transport system permease protein